MARPTSILIVVTNQDKIDTERPTGLWLEEFTIAYRRFLQAGYHLVVASPRGKAAAIDPLSCDEVDVEKNKEAMATLRSTLPLARLNVSDFDAIYFVGGHGAKYDFPYHPDVDRMVNGFVQAGKIIAAVCHGPAALPFLLKRLSQSWHMGMVENVIDHIMYAFCYTNVMWSHLESKLRELGAQFEAAPNWQDHVLVDHKLLTGQNPQSTNSLVSAVIRALSD